MAPDVYVRARSLLPLVAAASAMAGCFYFDPINAPPTASISCADCESVHVDHVVRLEAHHSADPDCDDCLEYDWKAYYCPSGAAVDCEGIVDSAESPTFDLLIERKALHHVVLEVTDPEGAKNTAALSIVPVNRPPLVELQLQGVSRSDGSFTVGRPLVFLARDGEGSDRPTDPDYDHPLSESWTRTQPAESTLAEDQWLADEEEGEQKPFIRRFVPDVPGSWKVKVVIDDGDGGTAEDEETFAVSPDEPPCITVTDPLAVEGALYPLARADGPRRFAVLRVADELDPHPPIGPGEDRAMGAAQLHWQVATPATAGVLLPLAGAGVAEYAIDPAAYKLGDRIAIRVEVADRNLRTLPCADDAPFCSIDGNAGCRQRITWEVEVR